VEAALAVLEAVVGRDTSVEAIIARHGEQRPDPEEFDRHFGSLPAEERAKRGRSQTGPVSMNLDSEPTTRRDLGTRPGPLGLVSNRREESLDHVDGVGPQRCRVGSGLDFPCLLGIADRTAVSRLDVALSYLEEGGP